MVMWLVGSSPFANSSRFNVQGSRWESAAFSLNLEHWTYISLAPSSGDTPSCSFDECPVAVLFPTKVLGQKIKLRRALSCSFRSCALHRMKVLFDLKCEGLKLLVNEAFDQK